MSAGSGDQPEERVETADREAGDEVDGQDDREDVGVHVRASTSRTAQPATPA